jgi:hypothetical protein
MERNRVADMGDLCAEELGTLENRPDRRSRFPAGGLTATSLPMGRMSMKITRFREAPSA